MDLGGVLLGAGLRVVERMVFSWIERGKSQVKVSDVKSEMLATVHEEADALRVRVDDLERASREVLEHLVTDSDSLSFKRSWAGPSIELHYDPKDAASGKQILTNLKSRLADYAEPPPSSTPPDPKVQPSNSGRQAHKATDGLPPGEELASSWSKDMLADLRRRVDDVENPRQ